MKIPRDISGEELARLLKKYGYEVTRQKGSHIRLTAVLREEHYYRAVGSYLPTAKEVWSTCQEEIASGVASASPRPVR